MTRALVLILALFSFAADAQQYVRPSKGTSFAPFVDTGVDGGWYVADPTIGLSFTGQGPVYDWSAFEAARIRIYGVGDGIGWDGGVHSGDTNSDGQLCSSQSLQYTITDLGSFLRFQRVRYGAQGWYLNALDAPTVSGPFVAATTANNQMSFNSISTANFVRCYVRILVTPIPFAPPSIAGTTTVTLPDGGITVNVAAASSAPYACGSTSVHNSYVMDGGSVIIGTLLDGSGHTSAVSIGICNSAENSTGFVHCRGDGVAPSMTIGTPGTVLDVGDCTSFTAGPTIVAPFRCIGGSGNVTAFECGP